MILLARPTAAPVALGPRSSRAAVEPAQAAADDGCRERVAVAPLHAVLLRGPGARHRLSRSPAFREHTPTMPGSGTAAPLTNAFSFAQLRTPQDGVTSHCVARRALLSLSSSTRPLCRRRRRLLCVGNGLAHKRSAALTQSSLKPALVLGLQRLQGLSQVVQLTVPGGHLFDAEAAVDTLLESTTHLPHRSPPRYLGLFFVGTHAQGSGHGHAASLASRSKRKGRRTEGGRPAPLSSSGRSSQMHRCDRRRRGAVADTLLCSHAVGHALLECRLFSRPPR